MDGDKDDSYYKIEPIVKKLLKLREVEYNKESLTKKYTKAKIIIKDILKLLVKSKDFLINRPFWNELHDRMVYYYEYQNNINIKKKLPLLRGNRHNEFSKWYYKLPNKPKNTSLLHFDTHDDMGLIEDNKVIKNKKVDVSLMLQNGCNQINYPVTCILLQQNIDHIVWLLPKWVYDNDYSTDQYLVKCSNKTKSICDKNDLVFLRSNKSKKDDYMLNGDIILVDEKHLTPSLYNFYHKFMFDRIHTDKKSGWLKLSKKIQNMNNTNFILDIDLDYFVTNGDKVSRSIYMEDFNDLESDYRAHGEPGMYVPRNSYTDDISMKYQKLLNKEVNMIEKRVKIFLDGCKILKKNGLKVSMINFSDSAPSYFSGFPETAILSNNYVPKYYVPYIHYLLINGLEKIFGKLF